MSLAVEHPNSCDSSVSHQNSHVTKLIMPSVREVRENPDRMLIEEVFVEVESLTGRTFDFDACSDDSGVTSHCDSYCSPSSTNVKRDVPGRHVWMHLPNNRIEQFIKHCRKCKSSAPQST
jgi:hypothetical protein